MYDRGGCCCCHYHYLLLFGMWVLLPRLHLIMNLSLILMLRSSLGDR